MTLGEEIRRLASAKGLSTQQELADAAGLSQSFVARIYSNQRSDLTAVVMFKLCDALGVSCDHFRPFLSEPITEAEEPERAQGKRK